MEAMTSIPATLRKLAEARPEIQKDWVDLIGMADAIDAHLAQPAQAVDVGAIREVIAELTKRDVLHPPYVTRAADKLTRALSGEKAGPVGDGWQPIETAPKDGTSVLLAFGGKKPVGGWWNDDRYAKVPRPYWSTDNERIVGIPWLRSNPPIAWMPLPASPTPDKEGA